jgi:hypothetical protein
MKAADKALARLREQPEHLQKLAHLVVKQATDTPVREIVDAQWLAGQLAAAIEAATRTEVAADWTKARLTDARARLADDETLLRDQLPADALQPLTELLSHPWSPGEEMVLRIIDQDAMRSLIRTVLTGALTRFGKRVRSIEKGVIGDLGSRARRRGRGLFGNMTDNIGGLAGNLVGAVKEELDHALDGRVKEVAGSGTSEAVKVIARYVANPDHAAGFAEFRVAIMDVILDTPLHELAAEVDKMDPDKAVDVFTAALRSSVQRDDFLDQTQSRIEALLEEAGDGTLGAWLDEVGLSEVWTSSTTRLVHDRMQALVAEPVFADWWQDLFTE